MRSKNRGSTRSNAEASQLRSRDPTKTLIRAMTHTINPRTPNRAKKVVTSVLLVIHPIPTAPPTSRTSKQRMIPNAKLCWRNRSNFQRNSTRFKLLSTMANRKFNLSNLLNLPRPHHLHHQRHQRSRYHPPPEPLLQDSQQAYSRARV